MPFDAFISYSHRDVALARDLKNALERFARPPYRRRKLHVFRDDAVLSANAALWSSIREALDTSRYLILIGSPEAAASEWVGREAEYWCDRKPVANVLLVVARGGVDAWPESLRDAFTEEPRFVDLRWAQDGKVSRRDPRFRDAVADLAAPLHGRPKDELVGDDVRQRRNVLRLAGVVGLVLVLATAAAIVSAVSASHQRNVARSQRDGALSRGLAGTATAGFDRRFDLAALLSIEAYRTRATPEAFDALFTAVQRSEPLVATLRRSHGGAVASVAWSPDGKLVAAAGANGELRLWDPEAGRSVASTRAREGGLVRAVAWQRGGDLLASGGDDGFVRLWRAPALEPAARLGPRDGPAVRTVAFAPDGSLLAAAGDDPEIRLWSPASRRVVARLAGHTGAVRGLAFDPDGRLLASASADGTVRVWDVRRRGKPRVLRYGDVVRSVAFSPDGTVLAAGGDDHAVHLWDVRTGRPLGDPLRGPGSWIRSVAFSPDGRTLVGAGDDQSIVAWDVAARRQLGSPLVGNGDVVRSVAFARDGRLASGSEDGTVRLWNLAELRPPTPRTTYGNLLRSAAFGAGLVAAGGSDGRVTLWSVPRGRAIAALGRRGDAVESVALSRDGRLLAAGGSGGLVRVYRLPSLRPLGARSVRGAVNALRFGPDSRTLAAAGVDRHVRIWRIDPTGIRRGRVLGTMGDTVRSLAFDRTGRRVAAADEDGDVATWEIGGGDPVTTRSAEPARVLAWDGDQLVLGGEDGSVRVGGRRLSGHTERVDSLVFDHRDRPLVVSGGDDRTIRIWDARSGRELGDPIAAGNGVVLALGWTPTGALAWATSDASFGTRASVLWSGDAAAYARRLCAIVGRDLSDAEWDEFIPRRYHSTCGFRA